MKGDRVIRPTQTLLLPYGQTICGKNFTMVLEAIFEYEHLIDPSIGDYVDLKIIELTGTDEIGKMYNMMHLIEAEDEITQCLMECLLYNENQWGETHHWWYKEKPE